MLIGPMISNLARLLGSGILGLIPTGPSGTGPSSTGPSGTGPSSTGPRGTVIRSRLRLVLAVAGALSPSSCGEAHLGERSWTCSAEFSKKDALVPDKAFWQFNDERHFGKDETCAADLNGGSYRTGLGVTGSSLECRITNAVCTSDGHSNCPSQSSPGLQIQGALTYSLYLSARRPWLDRSSPVTQTIFSTVRKQHRDCWGGEELSIHGEEGDKVTLSLEYYDGDCKKRRASGKAPLGLASRDAWGMGTWYHIGVSVDDRSTPEIYWEQEAVEITSDEPGDSSDLAQPDPSQDMLCMCASAGKTSTLVSQPHDAVSGTDDTAPSMSAGVFFIDDFAIFGRSLSLGEFVGSGPSLESDARLRWGARASFGSSASLGDRAEIGGWPLAILDRDWSNAGAWARGVAGATALSSSRASISKVDLRLHGRFPKRKGFELSANANNGRDFCQWYFDGQDGAEYRFYEDLPIGESQTVPPWSPYARKWCRCDTCGCEAELEAVSISSAWVDKDGDELCLLCGLDVAQADASNSWQSSPGEWGPGPWCWRPIAYNANSVARFSAAPSFDGVRARLGGEANTGALLVADFAVAPNGREERHFLDMSRCAKIQLTATLLQTDYRVVLVSENAATWEYEFLGEDIKKGEEHTYSFNIDDYTDSSIHGLDEEDNAARFDLSRVRYLGIQKIWERSNDVADVEVTRVALLDAGGESCVPTPSGPDVARAH